MLSKKEAAQAVLAAKVRLGLTWSQLADAVGRPVAWTTSALLGQQPMTAATGYSLSSTGSSCPTSGDAITAIAAQRAASRTGTGTAP
jgi:cyanate lyase